MTSNSPAFLLSNDLWARVFSLVAEGVRADLLALTFREPEETTTDLYDHFHGVQLVCRRFRAIFQTNPHLSANILLKTTFSSEALMSLFDHLQQHSSTVTVLADPYGSLHTEAVLAACSVLPNKPLASLKAVVLRGCTGSAASMLALCSNLTTCCLGKCGILDLQPLQILVSLSDLRLQSVTRAVGVGNLAFLTRLDLTWASIGCGGHAHFVDGLQMLSIIHSSVEGFHDRGVSACLGLRHLVLTECYVCAATERHTINMHDEFGPVHTLPASLSDLTRLTSLSVFGTVDAAIVFPWLFKLTNLVCLHLTFYSQATQHSLTDGLGSLHALEHLTFLLSAPENAVLALNLSWHLMPLLQTIKVVAQTTRTRFCENMLGIVRLGKLTSVDLDLKPDTEGSSLWFGMLVYNMAANRPQVPFRLSTLLPCDMLAFFDANCSL